MRGWSTADGYIACVGGVGTSCVPYSDARTRGWSIADGYITCVCGIGTRCAPYSDARIRGWSTTDGHTTRVGVGQNKVCSLFHRADVVKRGVRTTTFVAEFRGAEAVH